MLIVELYSSYMTTALKRQPGSLWRRLDKVGHVNSYSVLTLGNGERGHVTEFHSIPIFSVRYQAEGQHHVLDGGDVFAAVQPNSTNDTF